MKCSRCTKESYVEYHGSAFCEKHFQDYLYELGIAAAKARKKKDEEEKQAAKKADKEARRKK